MKTVYLDRNVILDAYLVRHPEIGSTIAACKKIGEIFPYSPAHVEEIVAAKHIHNIQDFDKQLEFLNDLSGGMAFRPTADGDTLLEPYDMEECRANVEDGDGWDLTEYAAQNELNRLEKYKDTVNSAPEAWNNIRNDVAQCTWENVFSNQHVFQFLEHLAIVENFRINMATFRSKEATVEVLYNVLDLFGFKKEENERRVENRMHDITHTIYAASADIFVTNDTKLNNKAKAIYHVTSTTTLVMTPDEFIVHKHKE